MVAYGGGGVEDIYIAPLILKLVTVRSVSGQQHALATLPLAKNLSTQSSLDNLGREKSLCVFRDLNRRSASPYLSRYTE